ncbi:hypothetical protein ASPSYDRAFT_542002 [Aspergillus sydowii CBS 593.65]|uniref:GAG-pre-integrase domain-containing protein n=1 Tax=Aspergillus sydowii CBS 593.65 TaxID=1036612 RepID=A0A1L9T114_9EURO|nr:uncharacterized protein ASPSYDRAFT_542002 [Aspergillus sydowii CBS 593.65]OJJ53099.1 hypothetical protein ASPSYDRAFT_542002 [Aspergillus sydowii CBS 593.65]
MIQLDSHSCHYTECCQVGAARTITGDRDIFIDYHEYGPNEKAYKHATAGGGDASMKGHGTIILRIRTIDGGCREYRTMAYFNPQLPFNLVSSTTARDEMGFYWNPKDLLLRDVNTDIAIGTTRIWQGVPVINTYQKDPNTKTLIAITPELESNDLEIIAALTQDDIYQVHRRLGHAGVPKIKGILGQRSFAGFLENILVVRWISYDISLCSSYRSCGLSLWSVLCLSSVQRSRLT